MSWNGSYSSFFNTEKNGYNEGNFEGRSYVAVFWEGNYRSNKVTNYYRKVGNEQIPGYSYIISVSKKDKILFYMYTCAIA